MSLEVGLRERKKIALREQLISTATRLFTENGYAETTLEHVAHENMVSIRTLLRHFESKEGLAIASLKSKATQFREEIADPARTVDSIEIWRSAVRDNALHYMDSPKMRDYHVFLTSEPQLIGVVAAIHDEYANSIAEGLAMDLGIPPSENLDNRVLAAMLVQSYRVTLQHWIEYPQSGALSDLACDVIDAILRRYPDRGRPGFILNV